MALDASPSSSWDNSTSVLQLLYPANSINPGNRPIGGAQFYATPLQLTDAHNVTLRYSAFFPADFDWVLAGKLPGLYGGRTGCSGGDDALDCFSTRLMWRKGGVGELYLVRSSFPFPSDTRNPNTPHQYAPKEKQTHALCTHPQSVCDSAYGLSIGRGSFKFVRGAWTTVQQSVVLNSPGKQDGSFSLDVNGRRVIERHDVFYRDVAASQPKNKKKKKKKKKKPESDHEGGLGDLLDPLLDGLFGRNLVWDGWDGAGFVFDDVDLAKGIWDIEEEVKADVKDEPDSGHNGVIPIGFLGLFFRHVFRSSSLPLPFLTSLQYLFRWARPQVRDSPRPIRLVQRFRPVLQCITISASAFIYLSALNARTSIHTITCALCILFNFVLCYRYRCF